MCSVKPEFVILGRTAERDMRINIPLIPICIETGEFRWRSLPPLRLRFTLRGLILVVAIAALFFSIGVEAIRLHNIGSYHAIEVQYAANSRPPGPPFGHTSLEDWHFRMANYYRVAGDRKEAILAVMLKLLATLGMVAVLGRVIHWLFRRSVLPSLEPRLIRGEREIPPSQSTGDS